MGIVSGIVSFQIIWWIIFFIVLPIGYQAQDNVERGHANSAPKRANIKRKIWITTGITLFFFALYWWGLETGYLEFRRLFVG